MTFFSIFEEVINTIAIARMNNKAILGGYGLGLAVIHMFGLSILMGMNIALDHMFSLARR